MGRSAEGVHYAAAAVEAKKGASAESASLELVRYHQQLGDHHRMRGEGEPALAAYRQAVACARRLAAAEPADPDRRRDLLIALGMVHKCLDAFQMVPQTAGGALPAELAEMGAIVDALLAEQPANADLIDDKLIWFGRTVYFYRESDQHERALQASAAAVEVGQRLYMLRPEALHTKLTLAMVFHNHAVALQGVGRLEACIAAERKSIAILEQLVEADPGRAHWKRNLLASRNFLAGQISAVGKHADALAAYERAAAEAEALARDEATNVYFRSMYRQARRGKCACFVDLGRIDEAVEEMLLMLGVTRKPDGSLPDSFPVANAEEGEVVKKVLIAAGWARG
jgi:tetratricopeptide (TPR) repeat protein